MGNQGPVLRTTFKKCGRFIRRCPKSTKTVESLHHTSSVFMFFLFFFFSLWQFCFAAPNDVLHAELSSKQCVNGFTEWGPGATQNKKKPLKSDRWQALTCSGLHYVSSILLTQHRQWDGCTLALLTPTSHTESRFPIGECEMAVWLHSEPLLASLKAKTSLQNWVKRSHRPQWHPSVALLPDLGWRMGVPEVAFICVFSHHSVL